MPASCRRALEGPLKQIAENAGLEGGVVVANVRALTNPVRGPQRRHRRLRGPGRRRHHRCRQGDPLGAAERSVDRGAVPHHRGRHHRRPGAGRRRRPAAAWATWTSDPTDSAHLTTMGGPAGRPSRPPGVRVLGAPTWRRSARPIRRPGGTGSARAPWLRVAVLRHGCRSAPGCSPRCCGIGGAVVTTPAVRVLGATPIEAVGSTVPAILPGAISGACATPRRAWSTGTLALGLGISRRRVRPRRAADLGPGRRSRAHGADRGADAVVGPVGRAGERACAAASRPPCWSRRPRRRRRGRQLLEGIEASETDAALVDGLAGHAGDGPARSPRALLGVVGAASGFVAGLLGVGGGIVMVPVLAGPLHRPDEVGGRLEPGGGRHLLGARARSPTAARPRRLDLRAPADDRRGARCPHRRAPDHRRLRADDPALVRRPGSSSWP